jgi:hypothetical protein
MDEPRVYLPVQTRHVQRRMRRFSLPPPSRSMPSSDLLVFVDPRSEKPLRLRRLRRCHTHDGTCLSSSPSLKRSASGAQNSRWDTQSQSSSSTAALDLHRWEEVNATVLPYADLDAALERIGGASPPRMPRREPPMTGHPSLADLLAQEDTSNKSKITSPTLPPRMPRRFSMNDSPPSASDAGSSNSTSTTADRSNASFPTRKMSNPTRVSRSRTPPASSGATSNDDYMDWMASSSCTTATPITQPPPTTTNASSPLSNRKDLNEKD